MDDPREPAATFSGSKRQNVTLLLLHGTFSDRTTWRHFETELRRSELARHVHIAFDQFDWSGGNSPEARAKASRELDSRIEQLMVHNPQSRVHIVAHSHGGNVAVDYLRNSGAVHQVASLVTIGTPFISIYLRPSVIVRRDQQRMLTAFIGFFVLYWLWHLAYTKQHATQWSDLLPNADWLTRTSPWFRIAVAGALLYGFRFIEQPVGQIIGQLRNWIGRRARRLEVWFFGQRMVWSPLPKELMRLCRRRLELPTCCIYSLEDEAYTGLTVLALLQTTLRSMVSAFSLRIVSAASSLAMSAAFYLMLSPGGAKPSTPSDWMLFVGLLVLAVLPWLYPKVVPDIVRYGVSIMLVVVRGLVRCALGALMWTAGLMRLKVAFDELSPRFGVDITRTPARSRKARSVVINVRPERGLLHTDLHASPRCAEYVLRWVMQARDG